MTDNKMVSIIIPLYNAEQYLKKAIQSVLAQTYINYELILVNDGSTDSSLDICQQYSEKYQHITLVSKENGGILSARLAGTEKANGEYIAFLDADDWIEKDFLERLINELGDGDMIVSEAFRVFQNAKGSKIHEKNIIPKGIYESVEKRRLLYSQMLFSGLPFNFGILPYAWNKIYKKEILMPMLKEIDKRIAEGEDVAFVYLCLLNAQKIIVSDYCGYYYRIHINSMCRAKREIDYFNESCLYIWLYQKFMESKYRNSLLPQLNRYMLMMVRKRNAQDYLETDEFAFPYNKVKYQSNILIYGAGDVGGAYVHQLLQNQYCHIVAWSDQTFESSGILHGITTVPPAQIKCCTFDYIVIAVRNNAAVMMIKDFLNGQGISTESIIWQGNE